MHRRHSRRFLSATLALVAAMVAPVFTPATAHADGWDFVYGDPGPQNYSRYQVVRSSPTGESYLAGFFTGTFHGLTATDVYRSFVQRIDPDGTIAWTVFGGTDAFTSLPATPDLLRDGTGNLFFRNSNGGAGWTALSPTGAVIATTAPQTADSAAWRPIAVRAGGILQVPFNNLHRVERRDSTLQVVWSFDHSAYFDLGRPPEIAEAPDGSFWLVGTKLRTLPTQQDSISMVHLGADGQLISSIRHFGVVTEAGAPTGSNTRSVLTVGNGFLWVNVLEVQPVTSSNSAFPYTKAVWSFATDDGRKLGVVPKAVPREQIPSGGQMLDCPDIDLTTTYETTTGPGLLTRQVVMQGARMVLVANCTDYVAGFASGWPANGVFRPVLLVYAADGPLGANLRRVSARVVAPGTTLAAIDADDSGNVTIAGSTTQGIVFSGAIERRAETGTPERAVAVRNPTGNIADLPDFRPLTPARLFDTRPSEPQGLVTVTKQKYGPTNELRVRVAGAGGVPAAGVTAVSLNVTVTEPDGAGFVTVHPCGPRPGASNLNFVAHQTVPNAVIAPVSAAGEVCFYSNSPTHLLADVNGWFATGSSLSALAPARLFDTRPAESAGAVDVPKVPVGGATELRVNVTGAAGLPASGIGAVSLNVTATETQGPGFVTVYPCGTRPGASSLNFVTGQTVPNAVIAPVSAAGEVCFYANAATHLLADVNGWIAS